MLGEKTKKLIYKFEHGVIWILVFLMGLVVLVTAIELVFFIVREIIDSFIEGRLLIEKREMLKIFAHFFNVLIGLELFETVKLYLEEDVFHAEFILLVGLIAVTRKVIILNYEQVDSVTILSIGVLIAVLAGGYFLLRFAKNLKRKP